LLALLTGLLAEIERLEVLPGHRVFELFAKKASLNQGINGHRARPIELPSVKEDGTGVLLAAEDQLRFFLPFDLLAPGGKQRRHHDRHQRNRYQHRRHRISALTGLTP
jgi:hypothetical protein